MTKKLNYKEALEKHPWIVEEGRKCILSPDVDGLLSGLLMTSFLNWEVVGFYNGKHLLVEQNTNPKECVFLDVEILRPEFKSLGHHMNIHNINDIPDRYPVDMQNCINPNQLRGFDRAHTFARKYPLGTIHLLLYFLDFAHPNKVTLQTKNMAPLFFADGTWKVLFNYTSNVLDWLDYLEPESPSTWWKQLQQLSTLNLIQEMNELLKGFSNIGTGGRSSFGHVDLENINTQHLESLVTLLAESMAWEYKKERWKTDNLHKHTLTKEVYDGTSKSNNVFLDIYDKKPLSLAMTSGARIEYTLEHPDKIS